MCYNGIRTTDNEPVQQEEFDMDYKYLVYGLATGDDGDAIVVQFELGADVEPFGFATDKGIYHGWIIMDSNLMAIIDDNGMIAEY
jgi:hypothetical protein